MSPRSFADYVISLAVDCVAESSPLPQVTRQHAGSILDFGRLRLRQAAEGSSAGFLGKTKLACDVG